MSDQLQSRSDLQEHGGAFIEEHATIVHEGHEFTSGGAFLAKRTDTGKYAGLLYAYKSDQSRGMHDLVGTWDGTIKIPAHFRNMWTSNMGDVRQNVYFTHEIDGVKRYFHGVFYRSGSDIVRVREVNPWR